MLYRICKRLIERGQTAGLAEKIDVFTPSAASPRPSTKN